MSGEIIPVNHELWMRDSDTRTCLCCEAVFTTFRRRHHCRYCGLVFCNNCTSKKKEKIQGKSLQRICIKCYSFLIKKRNQVSTTVAAPSESASFPSFAIDKQQGGFNIDLLSTIEEEPVQARIFTVCTDVPHETEILRCEINHTDN